MLRSTVSRQLEAVRGDDSPAFQIVVQIHMIVLGLHIPGGSILLILRPSTTPINTVSLN